MKKAQRVLSFFLAAAMMAGVFAACSKDGGGDSSAVSTAGGNVSANTGAYPMEPEELGSGDVKWSEEKTSEGWMQVTNTDGETLGYSADSGVSLIQVEGYAFKDLNGNGLLDAYEDWRLDTNTRAAALAELMTGEEIAPLMTHGGWYSFGSTIDGTDLEYLEQGGRAGVTRSSINEGSTTTAVSWTNALQALAEGTGGYGIPVTISTDPDHISDTIDQLGLGATMNTELAHELGVEVGKQYRAVGVTMLLGPQIDIATSPIWTRASGAYTEDPALSRDLAAAFIDGLQSTYDASGNDLGWGEESVIAISKHYVGAGASEGGRNDHYDNGKYTVFPSGSFGAHLVAFHDGAFNLEGKTEYSAGLMPNYAIAYSEDGTLGDLVGGAYSEFKMNLLRDNGYDGFIVTDWGITSDGSQPFGVEDISEAERFYRLFKLGNDQIGGTSNIDGALEGYALLVADVGEDAALEQVRNAARRFFKTQMDVGLFENPYITTAKATSTVWTDESKAYGLETQTQSIIMLKNTDEVIQAYDASAEKATVYIPYAYRSSGNMWTGITYSCEPVFDVELASQYYNVVTDSVGEPSGTDEDGNPMYIADDIIRASAAEIAAADYAIVDMVAPFTQSTYDAESDTWLPASLQYEEYTADSAAVRQESIAGSTVMLEAETVYGTVTQEGKENRSYYGNTAALPDSYGDYETLQYVAGAVSDDCKIIVVMAAATSMVWSEVEPLADAILMHYGTAGFAGSWFSDEAILKIIVGEVEPSALLPMQQPASMEAVEAQDEDAPRDMECYVDADGNTYDFAFGLNWSGVINDARVQKYSAAPLTSPETISYP